MIVNYYIELKDEKDQERLEAGLKRVGFAFYDATAEDPCLARAWDFQTLEDIEAFLKAK